MKTITLIMSIIAIVAVIASGVFFNMFTHQAELHKEQLIQAKAKSKQLIKQIDKFELVQKDLKKDEEQENRSLTSVKGELAKSEEEFRDKQKELLEQQQAFEDFAKTSSAKKSELARLNSDLNKLKEDIEDPSLSITNLAPKITAMEIEVDNLDDQLGEKGKQLSELATTKSTIEADYIKLNKEKFDIINSFDALSIELKLASFDLNWGLASLTSKNLTGLKVGDVLAVDLGMGDATGVKQSFILRVSAIDNNKVLAQFVSEDKFLKQGLVVGQKASLIKI